MTRRYVTADVFTETLFGGNPLAVVLDADGLSTEQMQAIAGEFNYSETTFVLPPDNPAHTAQVRIFTPGNELPFAGHPNVGTAYLLARHRDGLPETLLFEEKAGLVPVRLLREQGAVVGAELTAPQPLSLKSEADPARVAAALSLAPSEIVTAGHKPVIASVGVPFLIVEIASRDALRRAKVAIGPFADLMPLDGADGIFFYTRDPGGEDCDIQARMFSPLDGIGEDPATGSATASTAALIAKVAGTSTLDLRIHQGVDMGRPSRLIARIADGKTHVGGRCVPVMAGTLVVQI
jgi:trans-2,3-dihydro-3-hydroxyanthranilate isomerase